MSNNEKFIDGLNKMFGNEKSDLWNKLTTSKGREEVANKLVELFIEIHGTDEVYDDLGLDGECLIAPAMIYVANEKYLGLVDLSLEDSGEHYGTTIIHPKYGFISDEENDKFRMFVPNRYKYRPLIYIERDHHVDYDEPIKY